MILLVNILTLSTYSYAAVINAVDCSLTAVQNAVNAAAVGDTVHLPSCTQTSWTGTVIIAKRIILEGNGVSNTIIQRSAVAANFPDNNPMFRWNNVVGGEMRNMTLNGTYDTNPHTWRDYGVWLNDVVDMRIHHMNFTFFGGGGVGIDGNPLVQTAVIDHNTFTDIYYSSGSARMGYGVYVAGNATYPALTLGTSQNVFVEDNTFTRVRHSIASQNGGRYVFRHNNVIDGQVDASLVDAHGQGAFPRGGRQYEIYENTLTTSILRFAGIGIRGGDGVIFNNVMSPFSANRDIVLSNENGCPTIDNIVEAYIWSNTRHDGSAAQIQRDLNGCSHPITLGVHYFTTPKPGYTPYTYPHPLVSTTPPGPDIVSNLSLRYGFDEGSGNTANDLSGNNRHSTLSGSISWPAGVIGNNALQLNGSGAGGSVTSLIGTPSSITLAAYAQITVNNTSGGTVVNIGNYVGFRVYTDRIRGFYWNGSTFIGLDYFFTFGGGYRHITYVHNGTSNSLYVDGVLVANAAATSIVWTGQASVTTIGKHSTDTNFDLNGRLDEVRVYGRALNSVDIAALPSAGATGLSIAVVSPVSSGTFTTTTSSIGFNGTAIDTNGSVSSVSYTCNNGCTPTPAVNGTTAWSVSGVGLQLGSTLFTFTARDNENNTVVQSVTVIRSNPTIPPVTSGCTHYASPSGGGTRDGLSTNNPFQIVNFWSVGSLPGKKLCLMDGNYTGANSLLNVPSSAVGNASNRITIQALNPGKVVINGGGARPVHVGGRFITVDGIDATNGDNSVCVLGHDNILRNSICYEGSVNTDSGIRVNGLNNLIEDSAWFGRARKGIICGSDVSGNGNNTFRRVFTQFTEKGSGVNSNPTTAVELGYGQDGCKFENIIGNWNTRPGGLVTEPEAVLETFRSENSYIVGSILYVKNTDSFPGIPVFFGIADAGSGHQAGDFHPLRNMIVENTIAIIQPGHSNFNSVPPFRLWNATGSIGSNNVIRNSIGVGGASNSVQSPTWSASNLRHGTTVANALSGTGHSNVWTYLPGVCNKYSGMTITANPLWPWSMNQRIIDAMVRAGKTPVNVTQDMETLFGVIPSVCKSGAAPAVCDAPRIGTPPNCVCPPGTVEPNCEPVPSKVPTSLSFVGSSVLNKQVCPEVLNDVSVRVLDQFGEVYTNTVLTVSVGFESNPSEGMLEGNVNIETVDGIATFSELCVSEAGEGYQLRFTSGVVNSTVSNEFDVTEAPTPLLHKFEVEPISTVYRGNIITPAINVKITDQSGNIVLGNTSEVTLSIASAPEGVEISGTLVKSAVNGTVVFDDIVLTGRGEGIILKVESEGVVTQITTPVRVVFSKGSVQVGTKGTGGVLSGRRK